MRDIRDDSTKLSNGMHALRSMIVASAHGERDHGVHERPARRLEVLFMIDENEKNTAPVIPYSEPVEQIPIPEAFKPLDEQRKRMMAEGLLKSTTEEVKRAEKEALEFWSSRLGDPIVADPIELKRARGHAAKALIDVFEKVVAGLKRKFDEELEIVGEGNVHSRCRG